MTTDNPISPLLPAQISYNGRNFSARLGSLSPQGALLETRSLTLPVGLQIELLLIVNGELWTTRASITHTTPHEIGLLFSTAQYPLYAALNGRQPEPTHWPWPRYSRLHSAGFGAYASSESIFNTASVSAPSSGGAT